MSEIQVVRHHDIPEDEDFRKQWNALVEAMERPEVFYTWEWARAVAKAYGASSSPLIFIGYREAKLVGVAALATNSRGKVCFLGAATADYCDFVSAPADRQKWVDVVMQELRRLGLAELRLANLPEDSKSVAVLRTVAQKSGYAVFARPAYLCAQITLDSSHSSEARAELSQTASHKLKRMTKAAGELRAATVDHQNQWEEFSAEFPDFAASHVGRFLAAGEISNLVRQERRTFLIELAQLMSAQGWLAFSTLKIGGRSIAWNYGFRFAGKWFYYQPTFDMEARRLSAGSYLLCRILQDASKDSEIRTVDLGLGDESYKRQYAKGGRQTLYITASRSKTRLGWQVSRYRAASWIRKSPRLEAAARNCVAGMAALRSAGIVSQLRDSGLQIVRGFSGRGQEEISFLEWAGPQLLLDEDLRLQPVSAKVLAGAAIKYESEDGALQYLLRSGKRWQCGDSSGFVLMTQDGEPVHFCWVAGFEGFKIPELRQGLKEPSAGAVLIFDGWTPAEFRGRSYSLQCAGMVAGTMVAEGKRPWIISTSSNSTLQLERAGFIQRFSLLRKHKLFFKRTSQVEFADSGQPAMDLHPAA